MYSYQLKNLINIKEIKKEMDSLKSHREKKKRLSELIKAVNSKINEYKLNDDSIPTLYSSIKQFSKDKSIKIIRKNLLNNSLVYLLGEQKILRYKNELKDETDKIFWKGNGDDLKKLFSTLKKEGYIDKKTEENQFLSYFVISDLSSDNNKYDKVNWTENVSILAYLINELLERKKLNGINITTKKWIITTSIFCHNGNNINIGSITSEASRLKSDPHKLNFKSYNKLNKILASIDFSV